MPFASLDRLSSLQNPRVKALARLQQKAAERRAQGLTLVEGLRELTIAVGAGVAVAALYTCPELAGAATAGALQNLFAAEAGGPSGWSSRARCSKSWPTARAPTACWPYCTRRPVPWPRCTCRPTRWCWCWKP
ncbi:hypothetical protein [Hymenobacter coccineus]|uniref:hypothetical protein n=1 Tax=Hymenobacter coccineus TaxID=1908235 RepID=UPI000ACA8EF1|nr:hypothetical protein [Hymenobacter coccineus]